MSRFHSVRLVGLTFSLAVLVSSANATVVFSEDFEGATPLANFSFVSSGGDIASVVTIDGNNLGQVNANPSGGGTNFSFLVPNVTVSTDYNITVTFDFEVNHEGAFDDFTFAFGDLSAPTGVNNFRAVLNEHEPSSSLRHDTDGAIASLPSLPVTTRQSATYTFDAATDTATLSVAGVGQVFSTSNANLQTLDEIEFGFGTLNDTAQVDNIVITIAAVPEVGSFAYFAVLGLAGGVAAVRHRRRARV